MNKQILCMAIVLSLIAVPLWAQMPVGASERDPQSLPHAEFIKVQISGSAIPLANPLAGPFPILANFEGSGTSGSVSGQGMYLYAQMAFGSDGKAVLRVLEGQTSCRMKVNGEVLLGVFDPGETGWIQITDPFIGSAVWEQNWSGKIVGGTGEFAGVKGTFKKSAKGLAALFSATGQPANAVVQPWSGTLEIQLDK